MKRRSRASRSDAFVALERYRVAASVRLVRGASTGRINWFTVLRGPVRGFAVAAEALRRANVALSSDDLLCEDPAKPDARRLSWNLPAARMAAYGCAGLVVEKEEAQRFAMELAKSPATRARVARLLVAGGAFVRAHAAAEGELGGFLGPMIRGERTR